MAYRNDRTERARLHKLWITEQGLPCSECGSRDNLDIAHIIPYHQGGETSEGNCRVLCHKCNLAEHPTSKFAVGDKVRLNGRTPDYLGFTEYEKSRPRTIVSIRYDTIKQCNLYRLGSNGKGKMKDGQPLEGFTQYEFRSYQLKPYTPRKYRFKRRRHSKLTTPSNQILPSPNAMVLTKGSNRASRLSQEIVSVIICDEPKVPTFVTTTKLLQKLLDKT